ncbi:hypothetical protein H4219_006429 [Mycoemilia scoparia]|uniref:WD40 repeat-containing protein SMU1 n=1 Tax=Mycoemilia scoparia TaxID=417184 RepID=A0A9W8DMG9_9FUNG|nr:hypothetical protein H4219_006429 [Mycoemilia scoparia]
MDGEWNEVDRICSKQIFKAKKGLLYHVYKQQYLELIEDGEIQKAFTILNRRLKPLEMQQLCGGEFRDLCYLLTAKSIQDSPTFRNWDGIASSREKLVEYLERILDFEFEEKDSGAFVHVPPNRLVSLLSQAAAYQINTCSSHKSGQDIPIITSLLDGYAPKRVPNAPRSVFRGHRGNVKCVTYVGEYCSYVASGSSDNTIRIWDTDTGECKSILTGHTSRIWDLAVDKTGTKLFSASGDRTVKVWDIRDVSKPQCLKTIEDAEGDVYSVALTPLDTHVIMAGYDRAIRLYDLKAERVVQSFTGHELSVAKAVCNPLGNLVVSGSKDHSIRFWDILSGTCINKVRTHLGEVTSVAINDSSTMLLSSSKDNSNRLWDIRSLKPHLKLKGHQNTSKNFIRSSFAKSSLVVSGSEDGLVYVWDQATGSLAQRLEGHDGIVYDVCWDTHRGLLCSASDDWTIRTWSSSYINNNKT